MTFKKTFLSLLALVTMGGSAMADGKPVITVADVEALPGETVSFYVNLSAGKDNTYKGMALYAYSTQPGFSLTGVTTASEWVGASGIAGSINPAVGLASVSVTSGNALPSGTVENLLEVSLEVDNSVALGEYSITLEKTALRYFDGDDPREDIADDVTFKVKVVSVHTIVLDELATAAPTAVTGVNVKVKRAIKANSWSTICLPFAMTAEQITSAFGADALVKDFTSWSSEANGDDIISITIGFTPVTAMEANHPYLIKVTNAITYEDGFTVEGVNIDPTVEPKKSIGKKATLGEFIGTYKANTAVPDECLFINNDKFYYSNGSTMMKAFRGYFELFDVLTVSGGSARISMVDDETTGINIVHGSGIMAEGTYDLQGRKVENPKKGLYINNGKKVVVK